MNYFTVLYQCSCTAAFTKVKVHKLPPSCGHSVKWRAKTSPVFSYVASCGFGFRGYRVPLARHRAESETVEEEKKETESEPARCNFQQVSEPAAGRGVP